MNSNPTSDILCFSTVPVSLLVPGGGGILAITLPCFAYTCAPWSDASPLGIGGVAVFKTSLLGFRVLSTNTHRISSKYQHSLKLWTKK